MYRYNPSIAEVQQELKLILAEAKRSNDPVGYISEIMQDLNDLIYHRKKPYAHQSPDWDENALMSLYNNLRSSTLGSQALLSPPGRGAQRTPSPLISTAETPVPPERKSELERLFIRKVEEGGILDEERHLLEERMAVAAFLGFRPAKNALQNLAYPEEAFPETLYAYASSNVQKTDSTKHAKILSQVIADSLFSAVELYNQWKQLHRNIDSFRSSTKYLGALAEQTARKIEDDYLERERETAREQKEIQEAFRHEVVIRAAATSLDFLFTGVRSRNLALLHQVVDDLLKLTRDFFQHNLYYLIERQEIMRSWRTWLEDAPLPLTQSYEQLEAVDTKVRQDVGKALTSLEPVIEMFDWATSIGVTAYLDAKQGRGGQPQYFINQFNRYWQHYSKLISPTFMQLADNIIHHPQRNALSKPIRALANFYYVMLGLLSRKTYFSYVHFSDETGTKMRDALMDIFFITLHHQQSFETLYTDIRQHLIRWAALDEEPLD